jgi:hypothetical protein
MELLGANLQWVPHPGTRIFGAVLINAGGVITLWIITEEEEDEGGGEEDGE